MPVISGLEAALASERPASPNAAGVRTPPFNSGKSAPLGVPIHLAHGGSGYGGRFPCTNTSAAAAIRSSDAYVRTKSYPTQVIMPAGELGESDPDRFVRLHRVRPPRIRPAEARGSSGFSARPRSYTSGPTQLPAMCFTVCRQASDRVVEDRLEDFTSGDSVDRGSCCYLWMRRGRQRFARQYAFIGSLRPLSWRIRAECP